MAFRKMAACSSPVCPSIPHEQGSNRVWSCPWLGVEFSAISRILNTHHTVFTITAQNRVLGGSLSVRVTKEQGPITVTCEITILPNEVRPLIVAGLNALPHCIDSALVPMLNSNVSRKPDSPRSIVLGLLATS